MSYESKPADDRIESYLKDIEGSAKAWEIADSMDLSKSYVGQRCRRMAEAGRISREEGGYIIGHDIPGRDNPTILNGNRDFLLDIVKDELPDRLSDARKMSAKELQRLIRNEIAEASYSLGNRSVSYTTD